MLKSEPFSAGVFIGGMAGVEAEWALFGELQPGAPRFPVASTGAAALRLYSKHRVEERLPVALATNLAYGSLFRDLLEGKQS
jgi:hypothetical protein